MAKKKVALKKKSTARKTGSAAKKVRKAPAGKKSSSAKKKTIAKKISVARRTAPVKKLVKKTAAKKKIAAARLPATKKAAVKRTAAERQTSAKRAKKLVTKARMLGRPQLPADARLDFVFQTDYQAREVFTFLGVQTIRELEEFGPKEIIDRLTSPMVQTVDRIRKALALNNRCLAKDSEYAVKFKKKMHR